MISALLAALAAATAAPAMRGVIVEEHVEMAQVIFHSRVVIRVRTAPATPIAPAPAWREKKGPRCVPMTDILGAAVIAPNSVDLVLRGGQRMRARFGECPALDYYSGFYIVPPSDAQICADRDVVRDRAGGECAIDKFRALSPR